MKKIINAVVCVALLFVMCCICSAQETKSMTKQQRLENTVYLQDLNYTAAVDGVLCVIDDEDKTVKPHYVNDVFYVPLRFVVEKLEGNVFWEDSVKTAILSIGDDRIALSTRYSTFSYNGAQLMLDKPCFIKDGFTYVAFTDIEKLTGYKSYFYNSYNAGVVTSGIEWDAERDAEKQAHNAMEFAVSPFFKMFIK